MRIGVPLPDATTWRATSSPDGPGMSRSSTAMSYALTASSSRALSPSTRDVGGDRLEAQPVTDGAREEGLVLDDQHAHAPTLATRAYRGRMQICVRPCNAREPWLDA